MFFDSKWIFGFKPNHGSKWPQNEQFSVSPKIVAIFAQLAGSSSTETASETSIALICHQHQLCVKSEHKPVTISGTLYHIYTSDWKGFGW